MFYRLDIVIVNSSSFVNLLIVIIFGNIKCSIVSAYCYFEMSVYFCFVFVIKINQNIILWKEKIIFPYMSVFILDRKRIITGKKGAQCHVVILLQLFPCKHEKNFII